MKRGKVVLIGTGFVGMSMAYSMLNRGGIEEIVLIDIDAYGELIYNRKWEVIRCMKQALA